MKTLEQLLQYNRLPRVIGFDDAPFENQTGAQVHIAGVICAGTRFEGMLWGNLPKDGENATQVLCQLLLSSKFYPQIHLVLLDGLAFGGFNLIDLPELTHRLQRPCICLMRKLPDLTAIQQALDYLPNKTKRLELIKKAGPIYQEKPFYFQTINQNPQTVSKILHQLTDQGHVPEALRIAHLIGAAIMTGESGKRA
jgi:endonuclease V-like protein UPF0215 family